MNEDTQWVQNVEGPSTTHYVFGRIRQTTVGLTARVNYTITPTLTVQIYAQPFVSAGEYSDYKELTGRARSRTPPSSARTRTSATRTSTTGRSASTNVLRWEYRPARRSTSSGSRGARTSSEYGRFRFNQDLRRPLRHAGEQRVPGEVLVLAEYVGG